VTRPAGSRLPGFYNLRRGERLRRVARLVKLTEEEQNLIRTRALSNEIADQLIENVIGVYGLPLGIVTNLQLNGRDYLVPMVVEETSVVAAASSAAQLVRAHGSITARAEPPLMTGQIQILDCPDRGRAEAALAASKDRLLELANAQDETLLELGGGARDLVPRWVETGQGTMLVVHLHVDVRDAMGANAVNTMAEALGPLVADLTGGVQGCRIISNLSDRRLVRARMEVELEALGKAGFDGQEVGRRIVAAYAWAEADPYRAATHNKGIMNAVDAILLATGNDWRAVEAGVHAFASRDGRYRSLSRFSMEGDRLVGELELPMALGTVGGLTRLHPKVRILLKVIGAESAGELAEVTAATGLLQNFSALRSLVTEGIQRGHMSLHARNLAILAGARGAQISEVADRMVQEDRVRYRRAQEILETLNGE